MMELDTRTLYFMSVMVAVVVGLITVIFGGVHRDYRSVRDWGWAQIVIGAGLGLLMLRGHIHVAGGPMLSSLLIVGGMALTYRSFLLYREDPTRDIVGWALVAAVAAATLLWQAGIISDGVRSGTVSAGVGIIMARCAWLLGVKALPQARLSQRFTAGIYVLFCTLALARSAAAAVHASADVFDPRFIEILMITGDILLWISMTLGVIWMVVERQHADLVRLATRDPLTGALNRTALLEVFDKEQYRCGRTGSSFAVAMFDIDYFKRFNDTYGHLTGDLVLRTLVVTLSEMVRRNDVVARYGGEEFLILMPDTTLELALGVAERARAAVEARGFTVEGRQVGLTVSAGVAAYPLHGKDWKKLVGAADDALYQAKHSGRNRVCQAALPDAPAVAPSVPGMHPSVQAANGN